MGANPTTFFSPGRAALVVRKLAAVRRPLDDPFAQAAVEVASGVAPTGAREVLELLGEAMLYDREPDGFDTLNWPHLEPLR
jgi:hypothetical protein